MLRLTKEQVKNHIVNYGNKLAYHPNETELSFKAKFHQGHIWQLGEIEAVIDSVRWDADAESDNGIVVFTLLADVVLEKDKIERKD